MFEPPVKHSRLASSSFTGAGFGVALTCVLIMLLCCTTPFGEAVDVELGGSKAKPIKILNLLTTSEAWMQYMADDVWAGVNAALNNISFRGSEDRPIEFINVSKAELTDLPATIREKLNNDKDIIAILGPFSNQDTATVLASDVVKDNALVCLSPFSSSISLREWNPNAFFMRADPRAEIILLSKYIGQVLLVSRVGIMYLSGIHYGELESNLVSGMLKTTGHEINIITYAEPYGTDFNKIAFEKFAQQRPQAIIVFGERTAHTYEFVRQCLQAKETAGAVLLSTFVQQSILTSVYARLVSEGQIQPRDGQLIMSATNMQATDTVFHHVRVFREQMTLYNKTDNYSMDFSEGNTDEFTHRFTDAEFMLSGWIAGTIMARALTYDAWVVDSKSLQENLFSQNRFIVYDDFVIGDYGGTCTQFAADQGAICECNQGGHTVYLKQYFANDTVEHVDGYDYSFHFTGCYPPDDENAHCVAVVALYMQEVHYLLRAAKTFVNVAKILREYSFNHLKLPFAPSITHIDVSAPRLAEGVLNYTSDYHASIFSGPTTTDMPTDMAMIDPFFKRPRLNTYPLNNIVEVMPTLEQQFFVLMTYLSDNSVQHKVPSMRLTVVVRGLTPAESQAILDVVAKTAAMFGHAIAHKISVSDGDTLTSGIAASGYTLLVGLDEDDVPRLADVLQGNPNACVVLSYRDFSLHYNGILNAFEKVATTVQARLLTTTNLPLWTDYSAEAERASKVLAQFHTAITTKKYHTPLGFESFIVCRLLIQLMTLTNDDTKLLDRLYTEETLAVGGDLQLGPYKRECTFTSSGTIINCTVTNNYGASNIYVLSMRRVLNVSVPNDYPPTTPDISYYLPSHNGGLSTNAIVGIALGCSVAFILVLCLLWFLCAKGRDNRNAPEDIRQPVTLIFTDIESSTALWATLPQLMPGVVAMHHELIRGAVARHKCYEVKTVGDSFMIACREVYAAVQVACEIQELMLRNKWGTGELDGAYREFEIRHRDENVEYKPPTAMLTSDEYRALWNGLRVRIGIHTGLCDIRHDRVTGGIDYYGEASNMAARAEAIGNGGQILLTEWTWWSLSHSERASLQCESLGPQRLRGVPYSVEVYQLNSVPGRRYAGLRTELDVHLPVGDGGDTTSNDASALLSSAGTITGPAAAMAAVLTSCFSPFSVAQRVKGLRPLLQKWNIAIPQRSSRITDGDYCQGMINRLAIKMSLVAQMRQRLANGNVDVDVDVGASAQPHSAGRSDTDVSSSGIVASTIVQRRCFPALTADGAKLNPLSPQGRPRSRQHLQRMTWTHSDGDGVASEAATITDEPSRCDSDNAQGVSSRVRRVASDSVASIHIQMPPSLQEKMRR